MQVVVLGPNLLDQSKGSFHVHKFNCADTRKSQYRFHKSDADSPVEAASQVEVAEYVYADFIPDEMTVGEALADLYFFPCADELTKEA